MEGLCLYALGQEKQSSLTTHPRANFVKSAPKLIGELSIRELKFHEPHISGWCHDVFTLDLRAIE